jgi:hypothetical protein
VNVSVVLESNWFQVTPLWTGETTVILAQTIAEALSGTSYFLERFN